jgi:hypothetical protein
MTIYSKTTGLAEGIERSVNTGILLATTIPGPIMAAMLDGTEKILIIHYFGDLDGRSYEPTRKDGMITMLRPDDVGYRIPPSYDPDDSQSNIRAGVPLWLVKPGLDECIVLGYGKLHPRWSGATVDLYDPTNKRHLIQMFFGDPRISIPTRPEGHPSLSEQKEEIAAAGGAVEPPAALAPRYPNFELLDSQLHLG